MTNPLENKIDDLIDKIEVLVDVIEKGGRGNRPSSMYYYGIGDDDMDIFSRERESLSLDEFNEGIDDFIGGLKNKLSSFEKELEKLNKKINSPDFGSLSTKEKQKLESERNSTQNKITNIRGAINRYENDGSAREKLWKHRNKKVREKLNKEYDKDLTKSERKKYGSRENYQRSRLQFNSYVAGTKRRRKASDMIARSGFGNTAIGRYGQTLIEREQRFADIGNFANQLNNGGAEKIGAAIGGGKAGAFATKALGGFGKALSAVTKKTNPLIKAIFAVIDGLKALSAAMDDYKAYTTEMYKFQNKQEELQFQRSKQEYVIENQMKIENISALGDKQMKMLEAQGATMLEALKLITGQYAKSVGITIGPIIKGINETAYEAANTRIDAAVQKEKLILHKDQREIEYERYKELRELQQTGKLAGLQAEKGVVGAEYEANMKRTALEQEIADASHTKIWNWFRDADNNVLQSNGGATTEDNEAGVSGTINPWKNKRYDVINDWESAGLESKYDFTKGGQIFQNFGIGLGRGGDIEKYKALLEYQTDVLKRSADYQKTVTEKEFQLAQTEFEYNMNYQNKQLDLAVESKEIILDTAAEIKKTWLQLAQKVEQWTENFDTLTNDLGINIGYTNRRQLHDYQTSMFSVVQNVAARFGKSIEEVSKMQSNFIETTGRNKIMGEGDYGSLLNLSKYLGNDDALAANYAAEMEIFNAGVSDSVDMIGEVLEDVNRIGLNGRKYTKTLVDNLKLAEKYQFKGGTKNLMNMAKWAENTRFNLASLGGMLDKVRGGGLEGVITQSAEFQVLGGHAAMNSDPFAMMFEAYADPEAYARRMQDMTKGYGQIDKKTGETKFSGNEIMMMEQIAKIQGRSLEDVQHEVRARNKREVVAKQLSGNFDEEQQSFISNNATYNKETGQFQVKVKGANGKYVEKDVNEIAKEDIENIMPSDYQGRMLKSMEDVVSALEGVKGEETAEKANIAAATYEKMLNEYTERTRLANESYAKHRDEYIFETEKGMEEATRAFKDYIGIFEEGNAEVDESVRNIEMNANAIADQLLITAQILEQANIRIAAASGITFEAPSYDFSNTQQDELSRINDMIQGIMNGWGLRGNSTPPPPPPQEVVERWTSPSLNEFGSRWRTTPPPQTEETNHPPLQLIEPQVRPSQTVQPNVPQVQPVQTVQPNAPQVQPNVPQVQSNVPQVQSNVPQVQPGQMFSNRFASSFLFGQPAQSQTNVQKSSSRSVALNFSTTGLLDDGIISNNDRPILSQASSIIPINDGIVTTPRKNYNGNTTNIHDGIVNNKKNNINNKVGNFTKIYDGIVNNNVKRGDTTTVYGGRNVTSIHDGIINEPKSIRNVTTNIHDGIVNEPKSIRNVTTSIHDGIVNNVNKPMVMPAGKVTPINDGLVKSDPKDVAIFAKEGGVIGNFLSDLKSDVDLALKNGNSINTDTMKIEINGVLELSSGGQSINIIEEFNRNPILLRSFTKMLAQQIASNKSGGRFDSEMNILG